MVNFIDFPIFTGVAGELRPWISELEEFFVRERFTAMEKMNLAQSLLEGEAEAWFYRIQKTLIFYSWEELKDKLLLRFGDFADSDRIRLIAEQDRFLQEIRDEARIQRMKTTSIPEKDTIKETITVERYSNQQKIIEEFSENVTEILEEKKLIPQCQVPISSLEPSLSFSSESLDVSQAWQSEIVINNRVHSQAGVGCVKSKNNAHHVFDELFLRRHHVLHDPGGKKDDYSDDIFEAKVDINNGQRPQVDTVAESVIITPENVVEPVDVTQVTLLLQLILDDLKSHMRHKWESKLRLHSGFAGNKLTELDFHLSKNQGQEKNNGLLVFSWNLLPLEFFWFIHLEDKVCLSGASNSWWGWLVFDRGKSNIISGDVITLVSSKELWMEILDGDIAKLLNSTCGKLQSYDYGLEITFLRRLRVHQQQQKRKFIKSWRFKYKNSLRNTRSESREMNQFVGFLKFQLKHKWRSKHLHTISALGFYLSSVFSTVTSANFGRLQGLLEQVLQRDDEAYTKILDKLQINLKQGMDVHGASGLRLFLRQQKFSSIWHRWRRKDWDLEVQLRERDLMCYPQFNTFHKELRPLWNEILLRSVVL